MEWRAYLNILTFFYELNGEQSKQAKGVFERPKPRRKTGWNRRPRACKKSGISASAHRLDDHSRRLNEYHKLEAKVQEIEEVYLPKYGDEAFAMLKTAKANLNKWRGEFKSDLDKQTADFKMAVRDQVLVHIAKNALPQEYQDKVSQGSPSRPGYPYHKVLLKKGTTRKPSPQAAKVFEYAIDKEKDTQDFTDPLPASAVLHSARQMSSWKLLDWSDLLVKWGILLTGIFLLLGF